MTKRSKFALERRKRRIPPAHKLASMTVDRELGRVIFTTNNMLLNQLLRDGPKICKSFDKYARPHIADCSALFGRTQGLLLRHLPRLNDDGLKATSSRLLASASSTFIASIEVARHGFRRQYGVMARSLIETLATVITLAVRPAALEEFHAGTLKSTKCIGWAKAAIPPLGEYYGMLSNEFAHVGRSHAVFEPLAFYKEGDEALPFIINSLRGDAWLLYAVAELIYHDEIPEPRYWFGHGEGSVAYNPGADERAWMAEFLAVVDWVDGSLKSIE